MHRDYIAYFTWLGDELIAVPDFPAWVCDICGWCEYDENALTRLTLLLSPNAGKTIGTARVKAVTLAKAIEHYTELKHVMVKL